MGLFDKVKEAVVENEDEVKQGVDKVAGIVEGKVPDQYDDKVKMAAEKAKDAIAKLD